jgi:hypothetical protein
MAENRDPRSGAAGDRGRVGRRRGLASLFAGLLAVGILTTSGVTVANAAETSAVPTRHVSVRVTNYGGFDAVTEFWWHRGPNWFREPQQYQRTLETKTMELDIPTDVDAIDIWGAAVLGRSAVVHFSAAGYGNLRCFQYSGTTVINFNFYEVGC